MSTLSSVELGVLGPLQVRQGGASVVIPGAKPRAILTMLGLHCGSVVAADTLVELLWGQDPPRTAAKALQTHISSLRRTLGDGFVLTQGAGWVLAESEIDASRYKSAARLGRDAAAAGDTSQALARFEEALALWRGIPELPDGRRGTSEKTRWIEGHAALVEDRADALLATGRAAEVIGDLEAAVAEAPLRERRWGQLMLALYRAGRQGEALGAYQRARSLLADDLGVDPGPELRRLEAAIVAQDASLDVVVAQQAPSVTRAVTFLLTDIEGSTAAWEADADAMAVALARHDELVEQVVTSRGGRLIKTRGEGDATFSVFDRPSAGAAAAIELQDAITHEPWASRNPIRVRMALHTGEVELRDGDYFGRAVNRVARLRSLAEGGQILCSGATAELVIDSLADDVMLTDLGMRQLKNLARPEHVFELRLETGGEQSEARAPEAPMERPNFPAVLVGPGPFVGRGRELEGLLSAWQTALAGGVPTVLIAGEPGVGKTRLAGEWSQQAYAQGAVVLYGRCDEDLGAPYQPFAEALRSLTPCVGADRLRGLRGVEALLALVPGLADVLPDLTSPAHADPDTERYALFDAVVALLEIASKSAPIVLILDDLHWAAKPTLLLLRHLLRFGDHARVQIVGTYRSTDLDRSHPLAAMLADLHRDGTANRLTLSGLDEEDVTAYVAEAGYDDEELAHALASVTGGNPFFLIEALRHVDESGGVWDQSTLPQGVREAVSRRLSRLPAETNKALAAAAVVGSRFDLELVEQVIGGDLIDAFDEARQAGIVIEEPGGYYRFNHAIVRQSLLAELASVRRMRLHQRIAATLETLPGADDELLAELAHHYFECAWAGNAAKAVFYCRRAADQAMARLAYEGAADLYHQALHALEEIDDELADRDEQTAELLIARCEALLAAGDVASAAGAVSQLQVATVDSARLAAWATCFDGQLSMLVHPERLDEVEAALGAAAAKLAELDDAAGEATAHTVRAACLNRLGRIGDCEVALDDALTAARRAREHRRVNAVLAGAPLAALWGPNPVPRAGGRCLDVVRLLRITTDSPAVEATSTRCQAVLEAFRGRAAAARRMIDSARRTVTELGLRHALLEVEQFAGIVELIVDDPAAAEPHLRKAYNGFRRMGLDADTAETAALLGRGCLALDRDDEARELCVESERLAGHALKASIAWRTLRAHLLARGNDHEGARRIAAEAVALAERTDALVDHGDACFTLATVLGAAGDLAGARAAAQQAVDLYERKGAAALAEMARRILGAELPPATATSAAQPAELENECVRAVGRVVAAIDREAWDELQPLFAPRVIVESRRKIVRFSLNDLSADAWPREVRRLSENGALRFKIVDVVAVRGPRLAVTRLKVGTADMSPGAPHDELLQLCLLDEEGRIALQAWFDIDDIDAAIAELDAAQAKLEPEHPKRRKIENAATRVYDRFWSYFASRDWDAIKAIVSEGLSGADHRRVVNAGNRGSQATVIEDLQVSADIGFAISVMDVVAIRGERLALTRVRASGRSPDTVQDVAFNLIEIDADERLTSIVVFDLDDIDGALGELDARYLAGEAAPYEETWAAVAASYAALNRHEPPLTSPDCVNVDHRRETAFGPGDVAAYIHAGWDSGQDINVYVEQVHRLSDVGATITYAAHEVSQEGMTAEWRGIALFAVQDGRIKRTEVFEEADIGAAIRGFDQLTRPAPRLENAAARVFEHVWSHFAARDWDAMAETVADDYVGIDHRRIVSAETQHGRNEVIRDLQAAAGVGFAISMVSAIAIRGDRLVLARTRATGRDPDVAQNDALNVVAIDGDECIVSVVSYDLENIDDAIAELDARYATGEAADHARAWSTIIRAYDALNRREMPPTTPDWVSIDHRRASSFPPGGLPALLAEWQLASYVSSSIEAVHRLDSLGAVVSSVSHETSQEGFKAEWRSIAVITVDRDLVDRLEVFEEADLDAAIARFDELQPRRQRLANTASQVADRFLACFTAQDWGAMAEIFADDFCSEDRRRVVGAGIRHSRDVEIASIRAGAELGGTNTTSTVIATRGARLILTRTRHWGQDPLPEAFRVDVLAVVEINADNRIAARVIFDPDDFDAAIAELDARYLAGEAAAYADTWAVVAGVHAMFNRHEFPPEDWVTVDHRRGTPFTTSDMTSAIHTLFDLTPDFKVHIETVHQLNRFGGVITNNAHGSSPDGLGVEWRMVMLLIADGDRLTRCEVFDETDPDAAVARLKELSQKAPRLENQASRAVEQFLAHFAARDWDAMANLIDEGFRSDDRRRGINAGIRHGRDVEMANWRATAEVWKSDVRAAVVATRGQGLALFRFTFASQDSLPASFQAAALSVVQVNDENRCAAVVVFDPDDIDAAFEELENRYLAGEAAAYAHTWSVITQGYAALKRTEIPVTSGLVDVDRRSGAAMAPGELIDYLRAAFDDTVFDGLYVEVVHRLTSLGAVVTHVAKGTSHEGFDAEWRMVLIITVEGDAVSRGELFDETDLDAALARFEELQPQPRRLENAASQVVERFWAFLTTRNWAGMTETMAGDFSSHDHRKVVNAGVLRGRDANIANMRAVAEVGFEGLTSTVIATRGQRLVLNRIRSSAHGFNAGEISADMLGMLEIDADNRFIAGAIFDSDDIDAAFAELDARYLAGEAAAHEHTWSLMQRTYAALNRHEIPTTAPDFINVDHRRGMTFEPGEIVPYVQATWDVAPDLKMFIETVHRLTDTGCVITHTACGTSQEGFDAEWRETVFFTFEGHLVKRCEMFDETDVEAALARFDELYHPARSLENAASRAEHQLFAHSAARDWAAVAETLAANSYVDDHRRVVNVGVWDGRDVVIANMRALEEGLAHVTLTVTATRGERLALIRIRSFSPDPQRGEFAVEMLGIAESDSDGRIAAHVFFDVDDVDAAYEELETRYLAGEAAAHRHTWSTLLRDFTAFNEHKLPLTTPDWVNLDHRRARAFSSGDLVPYIHATWQVTPQAKIYVVAVHRLSDHGAVVIQSTHGTSPDGFDIEWLEVNLLMVDGDLINRVEVFDEEDLDTALERFDQLQPQAPQLENPVGPILDRYQAYFSASDWAAMAELLADDIVVEDRRRVVNAGVRRGRDVHIADLRAAVEVGAKTISLSVFANRGERLALAHARAFNRDMPGEVGAEWFGIVEITADERIVAMVIFDLDDIDAAIAELETRYLAGEATAHAHTWSVVSGVPARFNRHELPATTPDPVYIDHRPLVSSAGADLAASIRAVWDITSDSRVYIEAVHQLSEREAVFTEVLKMTSQEGFDAEVRMIMLFAVDGDLINRVEVFDEEDLDVALERFEELQPQTPTLENAASRVIRLFWSYFADRRWDSMAGILADNSLVDDRRRIVNAGRWHGRDAVIANMRALSEAGLDITLSVVATRGERLALYRESTRDLGHKEFGVELLTIVDINADAKIAAHIAFDVDDVDAAFEELDARYLSGEAAAHAHTWSVITAGYAALNRHELPAAAPDYVIVERQLHAMIEAGDLFKNLGAAWDLTPDLKGYVEAVHRLSDRAAVLTHVAEGTSNVGVHLLTLASGMVDRCEIFDEADIDAAIARFDELHMQARPLENAASRVDGRLIAYFNAHDWAAMAQTMPDDFCSEDRRPVVNAGRIQGREVAIANFRATAELGVKLDKSDVVAIRGERLALSRARWSGSDQGPEAFHSEVLNVVEINTDERIVAHVMFDPDDVHAAFEELDARYLNGEAAAHAHTWSVIARAYAGFNRHELPATTAEWVMVDRRPLVTSETVDLAASIRGIWDVIPSINIYVEAVHRLSRLGAVVTQTLKGTSHEGFDAEWRMIDIYTVDGDLLSRSELFDEADLDAALARFDELDQRAPRLENAATAALARALDAYNRRDLEDFLAKFDADGRSEDRRKGLRACHDGPARRANARAMLETPPASWRVELEPIAIRDSRFALARLRWRDIDEPDQPVTVELLGVAEVDDDGLIHHTVSCDPEDINGAFAALTERWIASGEVAHPEVIEFTQRLMELNNSHDWDAFSRLTAGATHMNHRQLGRRDTQTIADHMPSIRALVSLAPDCRVEPTELLALSARGAVGLGIIKGTTTDGAAIEIPLIQLILVEDERITHIEDFDPDQRDLALARFDELTGENQPK